MKKLVRILSLSLAALMLLLTLVACGAPAKDPAKAEAALEEAGYTVSSDTRIIPAIFKVAGYNLTSVLSASKIVTDDEGNKKVEYISVYYFTDKENAEKALAKVEEYATDDKESEEAEDSDWVNPTRSGAMIYYGTKAAIKAAK